MNISITLGIFITAITVVIPSSSYYYVINVAPLLSQFWIRHWYNHVLCLRDKRNPATTKYIWLLIFQGCSQNGY